MNRRVYWLDIVKYICIMWVMLSHLEAKTQLLRAFYIPFYLNGFFFASGYAYFHKDGFKHFFIKKVRCLLVPWLFFSVFNIFLSKISSFDEQYSIIDQLKRNFLQIRGNGDGIWFVAALFMTFIPFYNFVDKYEKSEKNTKDQAFFVFVAFALSLISILYSNYMNPNRLPWKSTALPWHIEYIFRAMFWMFLGYLFRNEYEKKLNARIKPMHVAVLFVIYLMLRYIPFALWADTPNKIINIFYSYASELLGVFILIYISKMIIPNKYLLYIGQNTLICYVVHVKVYSIIQAILKKTTGAMYDTILSNVITSSVFAIIFVAVLSFILVLPIYIINKFFPFLIGRRVKSS